MRHHIAITFSLTFLCFCESCLLCHAVVTYMTFVHRRKPSTVRIAHHCEYDCIQQGYQQIPSTTGETLPLHNPPTSFQPRCRYHLGHSPRLRGDVLPEVGDEEEMILNCEWHIPTAQTTHTHLNSVSTILKGPELV